MKTSRYLMSIVVSAIMLAAATAGIIQYISLARHIQRMKIDLAEINYVRYGLLDVEEWSDQARKILAKRITEFEITPENQPRLQESVENVLYTLVEEVEDLIEERTSGQFSGIKRWLADLALDVDQLRDSVPAFSRQVLLQLEQPENKEALQSFALKKLEQYVEETRNRDTQLSLLKVLEKYGTTDKSECRELLGTKIREERRAAQLRVLLVMILVVALFLVHLVPYGKPDSWQVVLLILGTFILLVGGVSTPMIDIEARIDRLQIQLLGEEIVFTDNILFFQSKSITDVVRILLNERSFGMILVGFLIFLFSIVFPSLKLLSSFLYHKNPAGLRANRIVAFFALKSGKWSMADVLVVAIFMAYIGFDGIISNQLEVMKNASEPVEVLTTNGTRLLNGFYLFLAFCLFSLLLSEVLARSAKRPA